MEQKVKFIVMIFVAVLLGSCAKNGEYKDCDLEGFTIKEEYPNAEVCKVTYYENDERIWSKTTVDGVTIDERKTVGENSYYARYNLDGDTTYFYISHENYIEDVDRVTINDSEYSYEKEKYVYEDDSYVELRAKFYKRKDISLYRRQYVNGKLNLDYTGCKKQFDENGNYSENAKEVWCNCPNENLDKFLADLLNTFK